MKKIDSKDVKEIVAGIKSQGKGLPSGTVLDKIEIDGNIKKGDDIVALKSPRGFVITNRERLNSGEYFKTLRYDLHDDFFARRGININNAEIIDCSEE